MAQTFLISGADVDETHQLSPLKVYNAEEESRQAYYQAFGKEH